MKRRVAISILGTTLDAGKWENRWSRWRPNVALCQQPGLFMSERYTNFSSICLF